MSVDQDEFLSPRYTLPNTLETKKKEDDFYKKFGQDYYYENGEKVYVLDEVLVSRKKQKKSYSFYDNLARYQVGFCPDCRIFDDAYRVNYSAVAGSDV